MEQKYIILLVLGLVFGFTIMNFHDAAAGGYDTVFKVTSFTTGRSALSARVALERQDKSEEGFLPNCSIITIMVEYRPEPLGHRTWSDNLVTEEKHSQALDFLSDRAVDSGEVFFGMFGSQGLPDAESSNFFSQLLAQIATFIGWSSSRFAGNCVFTARGLALLDTFRSNPSVFAFSKPI